MTRLTARYAPDLALSRMTLISRYSAFDRLGLARAISLPSPDPTFGKGLAEIYPVVVDKNCPGHSKDRLAGKRRRPRRLHRAEKNGHNSRGIGSCWAGAMMHCV